MKADKDLWLALGGAAVVGVGIWGVNTAAGAVLGTKMAIGNSGPILVKKVTTGQGQDQQFMAPAAADAFNQMVDDAYNSQGPFGTVLLSAGSAFRSYTEQAKLYAEYLARLMAPPVVAAPGISNHGLGIAVDIVDGSTGHSLTLGSNAHNWMLANGPFYGFSWDEGRSVNEPWHWDYLPEST
jgi:LAS superfamily LD-carboxypeptidase LdcB